MTKYIIGIDLGTTNCTLAYCLADEKNSQIQQFKIPQVTSSNTLEERYSLPSFVFFPLKEELSAKVTQIPWNPHQAFCLGFFARQRGGELPMRIITSAKSWLCHSGIDRREKILPLSAEEKFEQKMSALEACSELLHHLREAWDYKIPDSPFQEQQVFITVPASFDPSARQLVQEAAVLANYPPVILLEEPQSAFYSWLYTHHDNWREQLKVGDCILVVDIGGGTTDFSLISVDQQEGNLNLNRVAVGSHLLLGGDNIDLSLAYLAKAKFEEQGHFLEDWQVQSLVHACCQVKEEFMSDKPPSSKDIVIAGRGSRLVGGSLKAVITRDEAQQIIVEGFIPLVGPQERSPLERRSGFQQIGLPYTKDARISCQLAKFLSMTGEIDTPSMENFIMPTAVLFNGGTLKAKVLQNRLVELLNKWANDLKKPPVKVLERPDLDFAVSRGAVYYGVARKGEGIRIKSGSSCSYYIGVEDAAPAVPGLAPSLKAVCVVPFGMEEGSEQELATQEFALLVGETATFRFFSHNTNKLSDESEPKMGTVVKAWKKELTELPPIETRLTKNETDGKTVRVKLKSHITELGVLELWCVAPDERKWKLEFDTRPFESLKK